jgi:hypothetical protein
MVGQQAEDDATRNFMLAQLTQRQAAQHEDDKLLFDINNSVNPGSTMLNRASPRFARLYAGEQPAVSQMVGQLTNAQMAAQQSGTQKNFMESYKLGVDSGNRVPNAVVNQQIGLPTQQYAPEPEILEDKKTAAHLAAAALTANAQKFVEPTMTIDATGVHAGNVKPGNIMPTAAALDKINASLKNPQYDAQGNPIVQPEVPIPGMIVQRRTNQPIRSFSSGTSSSAAGGALPPAAKSDSGGAQVSSGGDRTFKLITPGSTAQVPGLAQPLSMSDQRAIVQQFINQNSKPGQPMIEAQNQNVYRLGQDSTGQLWIMQGTKPIAPVTYNGKK